MPGYGGETPFPFGLRISVEAPAGTTVAAPIEAGTLLKLGGTAADGSGYKAAAIVDGDDPGEVILLQALHRVDSVGPLGCLVLTNCNQIRRAKYKVGSAPTIGQSIETDLTGGVVSIVGIAWAFGKGYVTLIDTVAGEAEFVI